MNGKVQKQQPLDDIHYRIRYSQAAPKNLRLDKQIGGFIQLIFLVSSLISYLTTILRTTIPDGD